MTLDDLLEGFRKEYAAFALAECDVQHLTGEEYSTAQSDVWLRRCVEMYDKPRLRDHPGRRVHAAAKLYCVARDEGMAAAMLWKLSQP